MMRCIGVFPSNKVLKPDETGRHTWLTSGDRQYPSVPVSELCEALSASVINREPNGRFRLESNL